MITICEMITVEFCEQCNVNNEQRPIQSETFIHVFFECTYTKKYRDNIVTRLFRNC